MARSLIDSRLSKPDFSQPPKEELMAELARLLEARALTPKVARTFPLEDAAEALNCLQSGTTLGRVLVSPSG